MKFRHAGALLVLCVGLVNSVGAAAAEERSVWDKTRDGTVRAAKKTNAWIAHAAHKTDRWMNHAVEKVKPSKKAHGQSPSHPGPR